MESIERHWREAEERNLAHWDEIAPVHLRAYPEVEMLREGRQILDDTELQAIGDVDGKRLLHLQCHIGTDSLAWARRGATVTGLDFSGPSIAIARSLRDELGVDARFVHANLYDARDAIAGPASFDIVYTSRGVLCWLRDLAAWAEIIAHFLAPGGVFYLMDAHPILNALEEEPPGQLTPKHSYFHRDEPRIWNDLDADYADPSYVPQHCVTFEWTWTVSDILRALMDAGLQIERVDEDDRLFFPIFPSMVSTGDRWFRLPESMGNLPLLFSVKARQSESRP